MKRKFFSWAVTRSAWTASVKLRTPKYCAIYGFWNQKLFYVALYPLYSCLARRGGEEGCKQFVWHYQKTKVILSLWEDFMYSILTQHSSCAHQELWRWRLSWPKIKIWRWVRVINILRVSDKIVFLSELTSLPLKSSYTCWDIFFSIKKIKS